MAPPKPAPRLRPWPKKTRAWDHPTVVRSLSNLTEEEPKKPVEEPKSPTLPIEEAPEEEKSLSEAPASKSCSNEGLIEEPSTVNVPSEEKRDGPGEELLGFEELVRAVGFGYLAWADLAFPMEVVAELKRRNATEPTDQISS